jgi:hypothetical protein
VEIGTGARANRTDFALKRWPTDAYRPALFMRVETAMHHDGKMHCWLMAGLFFVGLASCSDGNDDDPSVNGDTQDSGNVDGNTDPPKWVIEMVEDRNVGLQAKIAVGPDGAPAVAYFANESFDDGLCTEVENDPPKRTRQELRFAVKVGEAWIPELVESPVYPFGPTGLDLVFDPEGNAAIAYTGTDPVQGLANLGYCGSHNAVIATRGDGGWTTEIAGAESGDSASGLPASDFGTVVGLWPGLAFDSNGQPAVVHKDVHAAAMQSDDFRRADAEFAWGQGGGWTHEAVDPGEGAGDYGELLFDGDGRPVAFYAIKAESHVQSRHGVWAARRETTGEWTRVRLHSGSIYEEISGAVDPTNGDLVVAFYSKADFAVRLRRLKNSEGFGDVSQWDSEIVGSSIWEEGQYVSLAFTPSGQVALAYHRCKRHETDASGCNQNDEAVVLAIQGTDKWSFEVVKEADRGSCGEYTSLAIDAGGTAHIAYRCTVETPDGFTMRLFVASKPIGGTN